jgi:PAS domain S-box-containing protein
MSEKEAPKSSQGFLESVFSSMSEGVVILDKNGNVIDFNEAFAKINRFRDKQETLKSRDSFTKIIKASKLDGSPLPLEDWPAVKALQGQSGTNQEFMIERTDTGDRWISSNSYAPLKNERGEIIGAIQTIHDITDRKKAEEQIQKLLKDTEEQRDKYNLLLNSIPDEIWFADKNKNITLANPKPADEFSLSTLESKKIEKLAGSFEIYRSDGSPRPVEEAPPLRALKGEIIKNEEEIVRTPATGQLRYRQVNALPVKDSKGDIIGSISIVQDITDCKQAEEALKQAQIKLQEYANNLELLVSERTKQIEESEKNYRELYESFGEAFIATDWELNIISWNRAAERVTTVLAKDALGKKVYEVLPEFLSVDVTPYFDALSENKPARFMMNVLSRETKKPSVFEVSTYPSSQGIIIIVEDKTEEEQTKRLSVIGATAGMVGHDIRNPLQAIVSDLYLMKDDITSGCVCKNKEGLIESLSSLDENISYINKIVQDLQDYARPLFPDYSIVDLSSVLVKVFENIRLPESVNLSINVKGLDKIRIDQMLIQRALSNLVANAVQAMPKGGNLKISGSCEKDYAVIVMSDTGVGIPDDIKPKLFTPMITTKSKGQGFGLAASKRLIEAMRGTISFESEEGKGTKFTIKLPLA